MHWCDFSSESYINWAYMTSFCVPNFYPVTQLPNEIDRTKPVKQQTLSVLVSSVRMKLTLLKFIRNLQHHRNGNNDNINEHLA
jgi:hypothetical protein